EDQGTAAAVIEHWVRGVVRSGAGEAERPESRSVEARGSGRAGAGRGRERYDGRAWRCPRPRGAAPPGSTRGEAGEKLLLTPVPLVLVGCTGIRPAGPFAKPVPITQQGHPLPAAPAESAAARPPAIKPAAPTLYVTPGDVAPDNPYVAASKLTSELTA